MVEDCHGSDQQGKKGVWELEGDMLPTSDGELEIGTRPIEMMIFRELVCGSNTDLPTMSPQSGLGPRREKGESETGLRSRDGGEATVLQMDNGGGRVHWSIRHNNVFKCEE